MTRKGLSLSALAVEFGLDRRTVAKRLSDAGVRPIARSGKAELYSVPAAARALLSGAAPASSSPAAPHVSAAALLDGLALPLDEALSFDAEEELLEVGAYAREVGLAPERLAALVLYGLPLLPPARRGGPARVSRPHAVIWRTLFALVLEQCGGDGDALDLAAEASKIRELAA